MAASQGGRAVVLGGAEPVFADVYDVTHGFFDVFGIRPMAGRTFAPDEERVGGIPAAVVSYAFWAQALGSNPDLASIRIEVRGLPCRVIGVMPAGFAYPASADLWISKQLFEDGTTRTSHITSNRSARGPTTRMPCSSSHCVPCAYKTPKRAAFLMSH